MPHIHILGAKTQDMPALSKKLIDCMMDLTGCKEESLMVLHNPIAFYNKEGIANMPPVVRLSWRPRPKDVQDKVAHAFARIFSEAGYKGLKISFHVYTDDNFYSLDAGDYITAKL